jgi:hypothetical protein
MRLTSGEIYCQVLPPLSEGVKLSRTVILGDMVGVGREMRPDGIPEGGADASLSTPAFTHAYLRDSGSQSRRLMSVQRHVGGWAVAEAYGGQRPETDSVHVSVAGSFFGGERAIVVSSRHPELRAAIARRSFADGLASALPPRLVGALKVIPALAGEQHERRACLR